MLTQRFLPVVTSDNNYLGWVVLDSPHLFSGTETSWTVGNQTLSIQKFNFTRRDMVAITFMGLLVTSLQIKQNNWNTYPNFAEVSANTPFLPWQQSGPVTASPDMRGATSDLQKFLNSFS